MKSGLNRVLLLVEARLTLWAVRDGLPKDNPFAMSDEEAQHIESLIRRLPALEREVVRLRYQQGQKWDAIALQLNRPRGELMLARDRALAMLAMGLGLTGGVGAE